MPVNSRYKRPFTTMPKIPSAIATITSSRKKTSIRSSAQLSCPAAGQPPLTASARLMSDPVAVKSGGQACLRTGARSEALPERNQLSALNIDEFTRAGAGEAAGLVRPGPGAVLVSVR